MNESQSKIVSRIIETAGEMKVLLARIPEQIVNVRPDSSEWSIFESAVHVRSVALFAYGLRIRRLVFETAPTFANYDEDSEKLSDMKKVQPIQDVADMIIAEHLAVAKMLELLSEEAWERSGHHPQSGELSITFLANRLALHAEEHIEQIKDTYTLLAKKDS